VIAKVKKDNKKKLAKARKVHTKRMTAARSALHRLDSAKVYRAVACGQQTGDPLSPAQLTQLLQVLAGIGDGVDVEQLTELLTLLFPSQAPTLSGSDLASILAAVNADLPVLGELAALANGIGGVLTPEQLQTLIMGILDHLTALTPGHATPEQIATVLTGVLTTLTGQLGSAGVHAVGELLHLLLAGMSSADLDTLTTTGLGDLLDQLIPGVSAQLDTGQLDTLLTSVQSGTLDPQALTGLLQGTLTPDQISAILDGSGTQTQVTTVLGALLPQLDALAGGGFDLPDAAALPGVLTNLGGVLDDLVGDLLCDTLPILCG
jgi:hypothetical protein